MLVGRGPRSRADKQLTPLGMQCSFCQNETRKDILYAFIQINPHLMIIIPENQRKSSDTGDK